MTKMIFICLLMIGVVIGQQQIPAGVQKIIDEYQKNPAMNRGFNEAVSFFSQDESMQFDKTLQFSDMQVGIPIEVYGFQYDLLDKHDDTVAVKSIIRPSQYWYLPISAHGRYIYAVDITMEKRVWVTCGLGAGISDLLQKVENTRPGSLKKIPILIEDANRFYLHFPQKNAHNLFLLNPFQEDALQTAILNSKDSSDNSSVILKHRKNEYKLQKPQRDAFFKKHPNIFKQKENAGGDK